MILFSADHTFNLILFLPATVLSHCHVGFSFLLYWHSQGLATMSPLASGTCRFEKQTVRAAWHWGQKSQKEERSL